MSACQDATTFGSPDFERQDRSRECLRTSEAVKVWRNIIARGIIAAAEQNRFDLAGEQKLLALGPSNFPTTFFFQLGNHYIGIAVVQCSTDGHLLMRVNVFAVDDLAWHAELPVFDAHVPIASAESWFHLPTGVWLDRLDDFKLWLMPSHLDRLAGLEADLGSGLVSNAAT